MRNEQKESAPRHIAIIMDGNGRWAQARGLPRVAGHKAGVETVRRVVRACSDLGVGVLTLYSFSTENWQRPEPEVSFLLRLAAEYTVKEVDELNRYNVRVQRIGRRQGVPGRLLATMDRGVRTTAANTGLTLNIAFNYGGRQEIVDAARAVVAACRQGDLDPAILDEATFSRYLYTAGQPDPDLVIRTSGESRLSNFLIWQLGAGALFWITPVLWPDFGPADLQAALAAWRAHQDHSQDCARTPGKSPVDLSQIPE